METELNKTEEIVDTTDPNATYITIAASNDLVQLVREQGGQVSGLKSFFYSVYRNLSSNGRIKL